MAVSSSKRRNDGACVNKRELSKIVESQYEIVWRLLLGPHRRGHEFAHGFIKFVGFFERRHMCGIFEPDELFGGSGQLVEIGGAGLGGDLVIVPANEEEYRHLQFRNGHFQIEER